MTMLVSTKLGKVTECSSMQRYQLEIVLVIVGRHYYSDLPELISCFSGYHLMQTYPEMPKICFSILLNHLHHHLDYYSSYTP